MSKNQRVGIYELQISIKITFNMCIVGRAAKSKIPGLFHAILVPYKILRYDVRDSSSLPFNPKSKRDYLKDLALKSFHTISKHFHVANIFRILSVSFFNCFTNIQVIYEIFPI